MRPPLVSILMPVFNAGASLDRAVRTIAAQTLPHWELIVVDDGSTDESATIARSWADHDSRIRLLTGAHQGIVAPLNMALGTARAPLIARMDADDEAHPGRLAAQVALLEARPEIGVVGSLVQFGGDPIRAAGYAMHVDWINGIVSPEDICINQFVESPFAHPSVIFRRSLIDAFGGYRAGDFPEDYELWLRWLGCGVQMTKVPSVLLTWHDPPDRLSRRDPRYESDAFYRCKAIYLAQWLKERVGSSRQLLVWGAGRLTRRRIDYLRAEGLEIDGYIDIDPRKIGRRYAGAPVMAPDSIPPTSSCFILGYVGKRGARQLIRDQLNASGFGEGHDYLMVA